MENDQNTFYQPLDQQQQMPPQQMPYQQPEYQPQNSQPQFQPPTAQYQQPYPPQQPRSKPSAGKVAIIIISVFFALFLFANIFGEDSPSNDNPSSEQVIDKGLFSEISNLTDEQKKNIITVLASVEITDIKKVEHDEVLKGAFTYTEKDGYGDEEAYRITTPKANNIILYLDKDNQVIGIRYSDEILYENGKVIQPISKIINRPDLELVGDTTNRRDSIGSIYIEGTVKNNSNKDYSYVQITFSLYDASGNKVGTALANVSGLKAGETWKFSALGMSASDGGKYKLEKITGN